MALRSRRQREQEQKRRMARGRRNLSQLAGPVSQGQRTPMNRGSGSVSTVQAPPFQQSNVGNDIMQAGLAYKGASGINDFATGTKGAYNDAGTWVEGTKPWTIGNKPILGEGGHVNQYFQDVGDQISNTPRDLGNLFNPQPSPESMGYQNPSFGLSSTNQANPTVNAPSRGSLFEPSSNAQPMNMQPDVNMAGINNAQQGGGSSFSKGGPFSQTMSAGAGSGGAGLGTGMSTFNAPPELASFANSSNAASTFGSGLMGGSGASDAVGSLSGITSGIPAGTDVSFGAGNFGTSVDAAGNLSGGVDPSAPATGLQGGTGQPWMAYANIAKDLFVGGPGSEKITGSTAGDAAIRAAAAYYTFGLSEIPYALF